MSTPLVSVILIGYNDAARITHALESLRQQTLRSIEIIVVDDASTDATSEIITAIAGQDDRVRYLRRSENSGGCSAPRNDGLAIATAPWVMFCDSDDEYDIHACANLLNAAERWDADVVCGTAVRHDVTKDKDKRWRPELHEVDRVVESLEAEPDLLYDTISVNKIYRRSFLREGGIEFPPELLFEDQVFTLRCFLAANRIGIVQANVYIWNVDRAAEEASITQGRMQQRNILDRIEINRLMDALLFEASDSLRLAKDVKFLRHESYLYLSTIGENPRPEAADAACEVLREYVEGIDPRAFDHVRPALRVALYGLLVGDRDLLRQAMRWERWASVVDTVVVSGDGRQFWRSPEGPDALGRSPRQWLDITHLHLLQMPFSTRRYFHDFTDVAVKGNKVSVAITTTDFAGDLTGDPSVRAHLVWSDRVGSVIASLPLEQVGATSGRVQWRGNGAPTVHIRRPLMRPDKGSVSVRVERGREVNTTVLRASTLDPREVFIPLPSVAFADRPAGAQLLLGERSSVGWRPGGLASGPVAWGRRLTSAGRRRLTGSESAFFVKDALLPGDFDLPDDRPVLAYLPVASAGGPRPWPLDLTEWDDQMADEAYLLVSGEIDDSVPTRLWGSIRDARSAGVGTVLQSASLVITDDPALIDVSGPTIVFRPDDGAARYLLPTLPAGYPVATTTAELCERIRTELRSLRGEA